MREVLGTRLILIEKILRRHMTIEHRLREAECLPCRTRCADHEIMPVHGQQRQADGFPRFRDQHARAGESRAEMLALDAASGIRDRHRDEMRMLLAQAMLAGRYVNRAR